MMGGEQSNRSATTELYCIQGSIEQHRNRRTPKKPANQLHSSPCGNPGAIPPRIEPVKKFGRLLTARSREPMRVVEVSLEQRRNERAGETGDPEKTRRPATSSGTIPAC
ncbi:hypothetical protein PR048_027712 [Dryococelus australis]|uniref:Uncharacterized protein n=1 Tax=Dryococelus australis TaxID=614101 RepID=A0ABQ9GH87_9NEOP|nr:hypothetical protein PR048_027712 [Dryococelus australis]